MNTEEKLQRYMRDGFCPVPTSHHPRPIQEALETICLQPMLKECYVNSQKMMVGVHHHDLDLDLEYHEGYAIGIIPFEHAWLTWCGEVVDLTLDDAKGRIQYGESYSYTYEEILRNMRNTEMWCPLTDPKDFAQIHPLLKEDDT